MRVATSGVLVAAVAYVADSTSEAGRARGMAWFGTSVSLGLVAGPALGGLLGGPAISRRIEGAWLNGFSLPFLTAGLLALVVLVASTRRVPESRRLDQQVAAGCDEPRRSRKGLHGLLSLVTASSAGLALFEGTFVLYGQSRLGIGPAQASAAFMVCGLVMAALQVAAVGALSKFVSPAVQVAAGLLVMGIGIAAIVVTRDFAVVLGVVALLAAGSAVVTLNLSVLVSTGRGDRAGAALGMKSAANGLGQFVGPLAGVGLLSWRPASPFVLAGSLLAMPWYRGRHPALDEARSWPWSRRAGRSAWLTAERPIAPPTTSDSRTFWAALRDVFPGTTPRDTTPGLYVIVHSLSVNYACVVVVANGDRMPRGRSLVALLLFAVLAAVLLSAVLCGSAVHPTHRPATPGVAGLVTAELDHGTGLPLLDVGHDDGGADCGDRLVVVVCLGAAGLIFTVGVLLGLVEAVYPLSSTAGFSSGCRSVRRRGISDRVPRRLAQLCVLRA